MSASAPRRSLWIPWIFVGGMLIVVAVNAVLVVASVSTFTGLTTNQAYDRGRAYNGVLAEAARQEALGWTAEIALAGPALTVAARDREGLPLHGRVSGVLRRPLEGTDLPLDFAGLGPGRWAAPVQPPKPGQWEARLTLTGPGGAVRELRQRVIVP
jgi:nitrogen fixation protein FixH